MSARLRYAFVRSRDINLSSQLAFDIQDERESLLTDPGSLALFLDRVRVLRLINEADILTPWGGTLTATLTASFGLPVLGARSAADATPILPLSAASADASFTKLEGTLAYAQGFAEHLAGNISLHGQTSFGSPLLRGEQIGIAGPGALSSFDLGALQGDSGIVGRAEVSAPFVLPQLLPLANAAVVASPYLFGALGDVVLAKPTALEPGDIRAASFGLDLRLDGGALGRLSNGSLSLEYGRQSRSDSVPDGDRFTLTTSIRY